MAPILPLLTLCQKLALLVIGGRTAYETSKMGYSLAVSAACGIAVIIFAAAYWLLQ